MRNFQITYQSGLDISPGMQKARPARPRFLQQEKRRGKNEKEEIIYIYI